MCCLSQRREYPGKSFALILVPIHNSWRRINCKYIHWRSVSLGLRWFRFVRQHTGRKHVHTRKIVNMLDGGSKYVVRFSKCRHSSLFSFLFLYEYMDSPQDANDIFASVSLSFAFSPSCSIARIGYSGATDKKLLSQLELHPSAKGVMLTKPTHL